MTFRRPIEGNMATSPDVGIGQKNKGSVEYQLPMQYNLGGWRGG